MNDDESARPPTDRARLEAVDNCAVVAIPSRVGDQWSLTGRYVEVVWSEFLGPTATLLARRIGDLVESHPTVGEISFSAMAASLGVSATKVKMSLSRLDRFGILSYLELPRQVRTSGLAPSVGASLFARLSPDGRDEHRRQIREAAPVVTARPVRSDGGPALSVPSRRAGAGRAGRSL